MEPITYETKTKIVATLGPASWDEPVLSEIISAGVDVCRINCSHADPASIRRQVARVRRASRELDVPVAILLDLQGPKIRTGPAKTPITLAEGDTLTVVMDPTLEASGSRVGTTYPEMVGDVVIDTEVLFADGALSGRVCAIRADMSPPEVDIWIRDGGELGSRKGINLPGVDMSVPALTPKDIADLEIGLDLGVDYVALSFVQQAEDCLELIAHMERIGRRVPIIAKIEKPNAVDNIEEILAVSEGVMVARGDLGVEVKLEKVPVYQKRIIDAGFRAGKIVITATQMLDSMERNPRPTRAETTDVANAIWDGTDAVMLSGETAMGLWPARAVQTMDNISREVESSRFFQPTSRENFPGAETASGTVLRAACVAANEGNRPLIVFAWTGSTAVYASKARLKVPIFALTDQPNMVDQLAIVWGVTPVLIPAVHGVDDMIAAGARVLEERKLLKHGEEVVLVAGNSPIPGASNFMKIYTIGHVS